LATLHTNNYFVYVGANCQNHSKRSKEHWRMYQLGIYSQVHLTGKTKLVDFKIKSFLSKTKIFSFQKCGRHASCLQSKSQNSFYRLSMNNSR